MRNYLIIICALFTAMFVNLIYASEYPIGCYSSVTEDDYFHSQNMDFVLNHMQVMGYNNSIIPTFSNYPDRYEAILSNMEARNMKVTIEDHTWNLNPNQINKPYYSVYALTNSSYNRFEAEYSDGTDVIPGDGNLDKYWYGSRSETWQRNMPRVGYYTRDTAVPPLPSNDGYVWRCLRSTDDPGYAYTDFRYRWADFNGVGNRNNTRIRDNFFILKGYNAITSSRTDRLYITFRLKIDNIAAGTSPDANLIDFETMGFLTDTDTLTVNHINGAQYNSKTYFTKNDYISNGSPTGYFDVEISIKYTDLNQGLLSDVISGVQGTWKYYLKNLNSRVYWYGNCDFYLDYIEIEDQLHRNMRLNSGTFTAGIQGRIEFLTNGHTGTITKLYSSDEPVQPQIDSYKRVRDIVHLNPLNPRLVTATYDYKYPYIKKQDNTYYDYLKAFREIAQPATEMPDIYPILVDDINGNIPELSYRPEVPSKKFIQEILFEKLLSKYRESKIYSQAHATKFIPVIQSFGYWKTDHWKSWILPPYNTQKCLRFLPLCYGADGIIDYKLVDYSNNIADRNYCAIIDNGSSMPEINAITYQAILDSNKKIKVYGQIMSDNLDCVKQIVS